MNVNIISIVILRTGYWVYFSIYILFLRLEHFHLEAVQTAKQFTNDSIRWLQVELETVGNVRVEYGKTSDPWCVCVDICLCPVCPRYYSLRSLSVIKDLVNLSFTQPCEVV